MIFFLGAPSFNGRFLWVSPPDFLVGFPQSRLLLVSLILSVSSSPPSPFLVLARPRLRLRLLSASSRQSPRRAFLHIEFLSSPWSHLISLRPRAGFGSCLRSDSRRLSASASRSSLRLSRDKHFSASLSFLSASRRSRATRPTRRAPKRPSSHRYSSLLYISISRRPPATRPSDRAQFARTRLPRPSCHLFSSWPTALRPLESSFAIASAAVAPLASIPSIWWG